jgi:hypothetical protein
MPGMEHLKNIWHGFVCALEPNVRLRSGRRYWIDRSGFATDARNLRGDFARVGRDLRTQLKREQADQRAR